jgi:hypothetical protein
MTDLIFNQGDIPKDQWRYGLRASADTGCGWIATYNALRLLRYKAEPEELIRYYARQLPLIHGNAGTSFWGPAVCFTQWGFPVEICVKREQFDEVLKRSDVCILFYRWRKQYKLGAHFVALQRSGERITGYNTFRNSVGPDNWGSSVDDFMKKHHFFGGVLIGIKDKR